MLAGLSRGLTLVATVLSRSLVLLLALTLLIQPKPVLAIVNLDRRLANLGVLPRLSLAVAALGTVVARLSLLSSLRTLNVILLLPTELSLQLIHHLHLQLIHLPSLLLLLLPGQPVRPLLLLGHPFRRPPPDDLVNSHARVGVLLCDVVDPRVPHLVTPVTDEPASETVKVEVSLHPGLDLAVRVLRLLLGLLRVGSGVDTLALLQLALPGGVELLLPAQLGGRLCLLARGGGGGGGGRGRDLGGLVVRGHGHDEP